MVGLARCICERRLDVVRLKIRKVFEDFFVRDAFGQHPENVRHTNAHSADAGTSPTFYRLDSDAIEKLHLLIFASKGALKQAGQTFEKPCRPGVVRENA